MLFGVRLEEILERHPLIDQLFINKRNNFISLTRVPDDYVNTTKGLVIKEDDDDELNDEDFTKMIESIVPGKRKQQLLIILHSLKLKINLCLYFLTIKNQVKNNELYKRRIIEACIIEDSRYF